MTESGAERTSSRRRFETGKIYFNPFDPPGKPPKGYDWEPVSRHKVEGYAESWKLIPEQQRSIPVGTTHAAESARGMEEAEDRLEALRSSGEQPSTFPTQEKIEESRSRYFPNAEDSLPEGDRN